MASFPGVGDIFGRYEIVRPIGRGGMGTVFEARQVDLGRSVALKVLSPELGEDPDFRARFAREARMLATLDSPHIIQVFDSGEEQGAVYIVTQLVHGRDLLQLLHEEGPLPAAAALRIVGQVASALADAHEAGVLHRDVKPSNVLIRESRADHFAYLCDFGIARHTDATHTRTGGVLGTLNYMAPECHEGTDASVSSDIYSLGCLLWATLSGRAPFERTSEYRVALAHLQEEIPTYHGASEISLQLNQILRRSMAKAPSARYGSAGEMHAAIVEVEEMARGLGRGLPTRLRDLPDSDKTQVRVAAQPSAGAVRGAATTAAPAGRRSYRILAVWAAALILLVALGGTAVALLGGRGTGSTTAAPSPNAATPSVSDSPGPVRSAVRPKARRTPADSPSPVAPPTPDELPAAVDTTDMPVPVEQLDCWDGSGASAAWDCPTPSGRRGLQTVFPSMDDACAATGTNGVAGKAEVFVCDYGAYLIRYSRWVKGADRYAYLDDANPGAEHPKWIVDGEFYGRAWVSYEDSPDEDMKYQWSATYRGNPYSVSVEGVDPNARSIGVERVRATAPGHIGLP